MDNLLLELQSTVGEFASDEDVYQLMEDEEYRKAYDKRWWERRIYKNFGEKVTLSPTSFLNEYKEYKRTYLKNRILSHFRDLNEDETIPVVEDIIEDFVKYATVEDLLEVDSELSEMWDIDIDKAHLINRYYSYYIGRYHSLSTILSFFEEHEDPERIKITLLGIFLSERYDLFNYLLPKYSDEIRSVFNGILSDKESSQEQKDIIQSIYPRK